jgi:hypothetical protein
LTGVNAQNLLETPRGFDFEYLGLIGFADPLRASVPAAVAQCRSAGIRVLMITGDYPATAAAIGHQAGLDSTAVLAGEEIEAMSDEALAARVKTTSIFARIRPNQKLRIVESLKANGEIVAVHIPIAALALLPLLLGLPLMLTPTHIAFLEMIIDPAGSQESTPTAKANCLGCLSRAHCIGNSRRPADRCRARRHE